jgi:glycosyltransferase involved in cell wall biosynthesis
MNEKKKTVLHLLYSGLGGHGSVFFSLVKADKEKKFIPRAVFCGIENVREDYIHQCKNFNVGYDVILKKRGLDIGVYFKIFHAFKKSRPAVLFLHGASFILPAAIYKLFNPFVKLIIRDTQAHHLKSGREWFWLRTAVRLADHLIFLTPESLEGIKHKINSSSLAKKAVIISNGLDTALYTPVLQRDISKQVVIGMQSRLQPIKDHPTLFGAFAKLKQEFPNRKFILRIAGDGETMAALKDLVIKLDIEKEVEFYGMLNEPDLLKFMYSLDIYIHATFGESMSNSIMQAMACGLPLIASDVWGVNNMVHDGITGLLYRSKDETDLCAAIHRLLKDEELRRSLSIQAREYAEKEYSLDTLFSRYSAIYS